MRWLFAGAAALVLGLFAFGSTAQAHGGCHTRCYVPRPCSPCYPSWYSPCYRPCYDPCYFGGCYPRPCFRW